MHPCFVDAHRYTLACKCLEPKITCVTPDGDDARQKHNHHFFSSTRRVCRNARHTGRRGKCKLPQPLLWLLSNLLASTPPSVADVLCSHSHTKSRSTLSKTGCGLSCGRLPKWLMWMLFCGLSFKLQSLSGALPAVQLVLLRGQLGWTSQRQQVVTMSKYLDVGPCGSRTDRKVTNIQVDFLGLT